MNTEDWVLDIESRVTVKAPIAAAYDGLVYQLSNGMMGADEVPMPMKLEQRPGGRWFRDLGDGAGHLWGLVQSIKPPVLLEISGQLFMSYPVTNHVIVRLSETDGATEISLRHRAFGLIDEDHRKGVTEGWKEILGLVKKGCEQDG